MASIKIAYSSATTITMDLSALATSTTFVAGVESAQIDNTTNLYDDAIVQGLFTVGTTPTTNTSLNVYVWGSHTSLATTALDVLDGTSSAETFASATALVNAVYLASVNPVIATTSDTSYIVKPFGVAQFFGGVLPQYWGLYVAHNMVAALRTNASNTDSFKYTGITYTVA
jgi:hypothetical protein